MAPPSVLHSIPVKGVTDTAIWTGYVDQSGVPNTYNQASGGYIEPADQGADCAGSAALFWSGLGGRFTENLSQTGTSLNIPGMTPHQAWWEILPASLVPINLSATPGQEFKASVVWQGGSFAYGLYNYFTGQASSFNVASSSYDGQTAEYIAERPLINGSAVPLRNFGQINWQWTTTNGQPVQNWFNDTFNMVNGSGTVLADTAVATTSSGGFTSAYKNCQ